MSKNVEKCRKMQKLSKIVETVYYEKYHERNLK